MLDRVRSRGPYAVEMLHAANGRWRAHVSFGPMAPESAANVGSGTLGLDVILRGVAAANVRRDGNREAWPAGPGERLRAQAAAMVHKYPGELRVDEAPGTPTFPAGDPADRGTANRPRHR